MKKWLGISCLLFIFSMIAVMFWYNEWKYSLPTPVPAAYHSPKTGSFINVEKQLPATTGDPVFLHFFNPDCPCSRFNMPHFKELASQYEKHINFAIVIMTKDKSYTEEKIHKKYGLSIPVLFDTSLAVACGVYSTPQAVLLDKGHILYYKGNYNRSRYCADKKSDYARIAIDSLLANRQQPLFNQYALTAYGCTLPKCIK